jgi:hypothetical protein
MTSRAAKKRHSLSELRNVQETAPSGTQPRKATFTARSVVAQSHLIPAQVLNDRNEPLLRSPTNYDFHKRLPDSGTLTRKEGLQMSEKARAGEDRTRSSISSLRMSPSCDDAFVQAPLASHNLRFHSLHPPARPPMRHRHLQRAPPFAPRIY